MSESMNSHLKISSSVDASLFGGSDTPKLYRGLMDAGKAYIYPLTKGYIDAIDAMINYLNAVEIDNTIKNKVMLVLTSLVFDEDDLDYLKDNKLTTETGSAIPSISEIQYINDIPLEFDIIQAVYLYILKIAKDAGFYSQSGVFGDVDLSGVMFNNIKNLNETYKSYVIGIDGEIQDTPSNKLAQRISDLCRANSIVRKRLLKLASGGKKLTKKEELHIRRHFKYNPDTGSLEKRSKPISNMVFALLANKNEDVFVKLKNVIK